jgi:ABC-2 type transport system ATP-binding protein/lipopolysaccharide transport system ATP-binding protein
MARITIHNASVSYYLRNSAPSGRRLERGGFGGRLTTLGRYVEIEALRDISLSLSDGDRVGLVGLNGSGKSTLLKLCAGAVAAKSGVIRIEGKVTPQFALSSGLRPKLTGRLNTELKCLYLGVPQRDIRQLVEEVKELCGLGGYFELPMHTYSAGMKSRLVISLLRLVHGEILLMDEWVTTVDASLNNRIGSVQKQLVERSKILLLASHSRRVLTGWVDKLIWMDQGRIVAFGPLNDVLPAYEAKLNS